MKNEILLQELITAVGYFCVLNVQNQVSAAGTVGRLRPVSLATWIGPDLV